MRYLQARLPGNIGYVIPQVHDMIIHMVPAVACSSPVPAAGV